MLASDIHSPIPGLVPDGPGGHQFVVYGDCCSGSPGTAHEGNFAANNAVIAALEPAPELIVLAGDAIMAMTDDPEEIRRQWRYFLDTEMVWAANRGTPVLHSTSNHNTYNKLHEDIWREFFPDLPDNGPSDQKGLSYWVRHDNMLLVFVNTSFSGFGEYGHVECSWLDEVLADQADAAIRLVIGHHPVHPANGYDRYPLWRIVPEEGRRFWDVLVRRGVAAYLCSHVIAFDVQVHQGVLQILTGGAGTEYGPGGLMPATHEYHHCVQLAVDPGRIQYQVLDLEGRRREWLAWPPAVPPPESWQPFPGRTENFQPVSPGSGDRPEEADLLFLRFSGILAETNQEQILLCGWEKTEGPPVLSVDLHKGGDLLVRAVPRPGGGTEQWRGSVPNRDGRFGFQLAVHTGMGPGGLVFRADETCPWSSLASPSARGLEGLEWPRSWAVGCGPSGTSDKPYRGSDLTVEWASSVVTP